MGSNLSPVIVVRPELDQVITISEAVVLQLTDIDC
jgi:hypothetical protein